MRLAFAEDQLGGVHLNRAVVLVEALARRRPGDHRASVERREHEHALAEHRGHRQQDLLQRRVLRRLEHEKLALARVHLGQLVAGAARELLRVQPGAVHRRACP